MYDLFIGCDVSKNVIDVAYYLEKPIHIGQFPNDVDGFVLMKTRLVELTGVDPLGWFVCFENTGLYSKALSEYLASCQIIFREENPLQVKKSLGMQRGKSDKADAKFLSLYAYEKRDSLEPSSLCNPLIKMLKRLLSRRNLLVKHKKALSVSVSETRRFDCPETAELFAAHNDEILKVLVRQISDIERKIKELYTENEALKKNDKLAQSVIGIGPVISAYFIAAIENFTRFISARKFSSYIGVAPFLHDQSGVKTGRNKVSHMANKKIKSLLGMAVRSAILHDPQLREYFLRKVAEGKTEALVMNNVKNKLVQRVFTTIKRGTPYVKLMAYT